MKAVGEIVVNLGVRYTHGDTALSRGVKEEILDFTSAVERSAVRWAAFVTCRCVASALDAPIAIRISSAYSVYRARCGDPLRCAGRRSGSSDFFRQSMRNCGTQGSLEERTSGMTITAAVSVVSLGAILVGSASWL